MGMKGKYNKKTIARICDLIRADTFTVKEICEQVGISQKSYFQWMNEHEEFAAAVDEAKEERNQIMLVEAKKSLRRKLVGYDAKETRVVTIPSKELDERGNPKPRIKEQITTTKHVAADTAAIIFTLTNLDPENWRNRQSTEITGKDGKDIFAQKNDDELNAEIEELKRKLE
jgi:hypothetical protein